MSAAFWLCPWKAKITGSGAAVASVRGTDRRYERVRPPDLIVIAELDGPLSSSSSLGDDDRHRVTMTAKRAAITRLIMTAVAIARRRGE
ncbi:hypothetical protein [uncultured Corynebacterium sp.]|uniref:hypothetical protein n=1 Tax=uncultured Corynebacterium sp. TaxID=159447 RepID=UPI0025E11A49|nr:hypothetical protein [uncultured Corynebacterium sp.]